MFTGIIETTGKLLSRNLSGSSGTITVQSAVPFHDLAHGESIAVNGVCLTLESWDHKHLSFHTLEETLKRTNLGTLPEKATVNLERALKFGDRIGGHLVSGHVDCTGKVVSVKTIAGDIELAVAFPPSLNPFLIGKGSIAIDGVSLTLVDVKSEVFTVHLIPVTWKETALPERKPGRLVNLETDLLGKYVARQLHLQMSGKKYPVTMDSLQKAGWDI